MKTLSEWEKWLKPFFVSGLRIIGEIPLTEPDVNELAEEVRKFLAGYDQFTRATNDLTKYFPFVFMTLLAHFSMYNDQSGYWHALQQAIGADQDLHITRWHHRFVNLARKSNLKTFFSSDTPNFYVASIRFHGGIPSYYLPDFFERMVYPAVKDLKKIPPKDALNYLLPRAHMGRPVLDFLENSGEMGLAWFEACCKLVQHAMENHGEVLPISAVLELPYNIHSFFEQYSEEREDRGFHWSRPYLEINPLSEGSPVILRIPEQIITTQAASQELQWTITWPGQKEPIINYCEVYHRRSGEYTSEVIQPIPLPTTQVTVSISSREDAQEDSELRRWTLTLLPTPDQAPLVAFRANLRQVPNARSLPAQVLFLLTPRTAELEIDPLTTERIDSFQAFYGDWKDWKLEQWDLTQAISLLVHQDGEVLGNVIPVAREADLPELCGGHRFDYQENLDQPLYTSAIPSVSIPISSNAEKLQALMDWKVRVISIGEAAPNLNREVNIVKYQNDLLFEDSRAIFPLKVLIGEKPAGIYEIKVSGPRGIKVDFRLRLWPRLLLQNYSKDLPQAVESRNPVEFNVYLQDGAWIETQAGADPVEIIRAGIGFSITAKPLLRSIALDLVTMSRTGEEIRVPVSIPVVRLRWGLVEEKTPSLLNLGQTVIHVSKERFAQYVSSSLHVEMHGLSEMIGRMCCQLVESEDESKLLQCADFRKTGFGPDWLKVSLLQFSETIRNINTQVQFQLVFQKDNRSQSIRYALLEVSPEMDVRDARLEQVSECDWKLTWDEDLPLKNRRVMLKSAWQPWAATIEETIPDENKGEFIFKNIALPPSSYEFYFYTKFKWEPTSEVPPENARCLKVALCTPQERLLELNSQSKDHDLSFRNNIEEACIQDSLEEKEKRDMAISEAAKHLIHLSDLRTLVGSIQWMRTKDVSPPYKSFFRKQMFNNKLLEIILEKYPQRDVNLVQYLRMLGEVKTSSAKAIITADSARLLLKKVDDPLIISICVRTLLEREDEELPQLVMGLIKRGSLTTEDAASLLMDIREKRLWAIQRISELEQTSFSIALLATMLQDFFYEKEKYGDDDEIEDVEVIPAWMQDAFVRVINQRQSTMLVSRYLGSLINGGHDKAWSELIKQKKEGRINDEEFYSLLRLDPQNAIGRLRLLSKKKDLSEWIQKLEEDYPEAAGVLKPGMTLNTPFGQARIVSINLTDGRKVTRVLKSDRNFIINTISGEGLERIEVSLDFQKLLMIFKKYNSIYRCRNCNVFCHPLPRKMDQHQKEAHRSETRSFGIIKNTVAFTTDEVSYVNHSE
jgi:hypothetical protein